MREQPMGEAPSRGVKALTVALVIGAAAAFVQTQVLKAEEPPVRALEFDDRLAPGCRCDEAAARLSVRLSDAQRLDATIVDDRERPVRRLATNALRGGGPSTFVWTGRDDAGGLAPEGEYRLRLDLSEPDRSITLSKVIELRASRG